MKQTKKAFTLVEFLVGITITTLVFIVATNLMIGFLKVDTKSQRSQDLEQAKSDLSSEFTNTLQWANSVNFSGGVLHVDSNTYSVSNGVFLKNGNALTNNKVVISNFNVQRFSVAASHSGPSVGNGLLGSYFNSNDLTNLVTTKNDPLLDFNWGSYPPTQGIQTSNYSVQWLGQIVPKTTGLYTFYSNANSGTRLWIDNTLVFDNWLGSGQPVSGTMSLSRNKWVDFRYEYHNNSTSSHLSLKWAGPGVSQEIIPTQNLYAQSSQIGYQITLDLSHADSTDIHDTISLFIAPRENSSQTVVSQQ